MDFSPCDEAYTASRQVSKILKAGLVISLLLFSGEYIPAAQECIGINFFDPPNSYLQSYTCWDSNGKSYVYLGGGATRDA